MRSFVIAGGGTAGWIAAAALARALEGASCEIALVESPVIDTVGLGEATIPSLPLFHQLLGIGEREVLRATGATFKLGIRFRDWGRTGETFLHPFGPYGLDIEHEVFQAWWLRRREEGHPTPLEEWSVTGLAATLGRFGAGRSGDSSPLRHLSHAYHLDAMLYARLLRAYAEKRGVKRIEGEAVDAGRDERGLIESLRLRDGRSVRGDFFIDCSGPPALLIAGALQTGYEDWSHWLPCDRAAEVRCESATDPLPVTQSTALQSGWQWRIPLQHCIGNGHVYCSAHLSDDEAAARLLERLEAPPLSDPRLQRFRAGRRARAWAGNCLALGAAAGFLEPLEATGMHFVQSGLARLFALFPDRRFDPAVSDEYNRLTALEYERTRDFLILHYAASRRDDAPFWRERRAARLPQGLAHKLELFARTGRIAVLEEETFPPASWLAVLTGLGIRPQRHEPVIDIFTAAAPAARFEAMREVIRNSVGTLPAHAAYLRELSGHA